MSDYIEIGNDRAVRLDEYQGAFSISMHRKYQDKWYWQGCKVIIGKDQIADKTSPMKATLGKVWASTRSSSTSRPGAAVSAPS